jgi:hypothetical protein
LNTQDLRYPSPIAFAKIFPLGPRIRKDDSMSQNGDLERRSASGYSSHVQLYLEMSGRTIALSEIGPGFVSLREPTDIPPGDAEVVMRIDDHETRWSVELPNGAAAVPFDLMIATIDR